MKNLKQILIIFCLTAMIPQAYSQWSQSISIPGRFVKSIVKCQDKFFAGTSSGILNLGEIYSSADNGHSWQIVNTGFNISGVFSMAVKDSFIYVGTYQDGLLRSSDAGQTWTLNDLGVWRLGVFGVGVSGESNVFIYVNHGSGRSLSTNNGLTFTPLSINSQLLQFQTFADLPGKFLAGSRRGVALSENNGADWVLQPNKGLPHNPDGTSPVPAVYYFNDKLFAGCIDRMNVSTDFGNSFAQTNILLSNFEYFTTMTSSGNKLFAGISAHTNPAVIMTTNDGETWINYQENGFPGNRVYSLAVSDEYLIAGTSQSGIWIRPHYKLDMNILMSFEGFFNRDTVTVELRNSNSPFNLIESTKGMGGLCFPYPFAFNNAVEDFPYYIAVKHRNSITTWSNGPVEFKDKASVYDFTLSQSQALGSNLVFANAAWSVYSGDVNQDGIVDLADGNLIYNDISDFTSGYVNTDLNFDSIVDLGDLLLQFNNGRKFVSEIKP